MRLFVAVEVAPSARAAIAEAVAPHRHDGRLAWTRPEGWHVTLAFLGEVEDDVVGEVEAATAAGVTSTRADHAPSVTTGDPVVLGRGALAIELVDEPRGVLARLGASVQQAVEDAGLPVHRRAVTPHLTLGRARRRQRVPRDVVGRIEVPTVGWTVDHVTVVQSVLGRGPATYHAVASVPLRSTGC